MQVLVELHVFPYDPFLLPVLTPIQWVLQVNLPWNFPAIEDPSTTIYAIVIQWGISL